MKILRGAPGRLIVGAIRLYQASISSLLPGTCRYTPTCSEYAATAVGRFGAAQGSWMAARRLARCHPLGGNGYDPVPAARRADGELH